MQALQFLNCENLALKTLNLVNSTRSHITIASCKDSIITDIYISAPDDSPNTDGINISGSSNILIQDSKIESGNSLIHPHSNFRNILPILRHHHYLFSYYYHKLKLARKFKTEPILHDFIFIISFIINFYTYRG